MARLRACDPAASVLVILCIQLFFVRVCVTVRLDHAIQ